ncbi:aminoglycoside phosphotransferase family protein [Microlunatus parietis]|uniref:Aminoglycoside phosphotransferase domain-containing protein n=1 Tax=Microlunatus parietis TaxID=682979 RepID=A0A7Y9I6E9_9ACTN|nr:aminoglycoside phosphotransferase family protein [Microlunatus parietis]NYE71148.1 hypothetical protein [Microlunatus parietis]
MAYPSEVLYEPITGATVGVWRVDLPGGSMVLKQIHCGSSGDPRWPTSADPASNYYWRREADLLAPDSALRAALDGVPGGIRPVRCHGVFDRPDDTVALWLEHLTGVYGARWDPDRYGIVAAQLGRTQGALTESALLAAPELSRTWLREHVALHRADGDPLARPGIWEPALAAGLFAPDAPDRMNALWAKLPAWLDRVEALPRTLTHFDFHPGNLFDADGETVVIDWAYAGVGPVGLDPACLALEAVYDHHLAPEVLPELFDLVVDGYATGYRQAGGILDAAAVRQAMIIGVAVKLGWTVPALLEAVAENRATLNGAPLAEGARNWAAAGNLLLNLVEDVDDGEPAPTSQTKRPPAGAAIIEEKP